MFKHIMELDFEGWLYGLVAALIGGGASAVSGGIAVTMIDPKDFGASWKTIQLMGVTFLISGMMNAFYYLKDSPVPKRITETTQTTTTSQVIETKETVKEIKPAGAIVEPPTTKS